jgi:hypothetical protein
VPSAHDRAARLDSIARTMRFSVEGRETAHSLMRSTVQPDRRRALATRMSRRLLYSNLSTQKRRLVLGIFLQLHPCQKHPSTNTAIFRPGHAKSGRPRIGQCFLHPRIPAAQIIFPRAISVVRLPFGRIDAMMRERASLEMRSKCASTLCPSLRCCAYPF